MEYTVILVRNTHSEQNQLLAALPESERQRLFVHLESVQILTMTQELIANMLGVRREGVTEAAGKLQDAGLIHYSRGHIAVLDRRGLEARACECYRVVKKEIDRLIPDVTATQAVEPRCIRTTLSPHGAECALPHHIH